ncbi:Flagellar hook-length control protein FliK [Minicystis rosea]|nr:Flagellar hook-length control protein FliK [Minicystis rosea]
MRRHSFNPEVSPMRRFAIAYCFFGSVLAAGCTNTSGPESVDGHVAETQAPIAYGAQDTIHTAVVALVGNTSQGQFACSGSIVQVKNGQGYVLTAAHCCAESAPSWVITGTNYASQSAPTYNVVAGSVYYDAQYNPNNLPAGHDFCMLKFSGASASTPTLKLPTSTADGVASNVSVEHVGYGMTNTNSNNSTRQTGTDKITSFDATGTTFSYKQGGAAQTPGPCEGDSGGPALIPTGAGVTQAQQTVVGVTSFGTTETCGASDTGTSGRVSSVIGTDNNNKPLFITAYLNDAPIGTPAGSTPPPTCESCQGDALNQGGACANTYASCYNNAACKGILTCQQACGSDNTCASNCYTSATAAAKSLYDAILTCICDTGCPTDCATECGGSAPACGLATKDATCNTCIEGSCCTATKDCAGDSTCVNCLKATNPPASCNSNAKVVAFYGCLEDNCNVECLGGTTSTSSSSSSGSATTSSSGGTATGTGSASGNPMTTGVGGSTGAAGNGGEGGDGGGANNQEGSCSVGAAGSAPVSGLRSRGSWRASRSRSRVAVVAVDWALTIQRAFPRPILGHPPRRHTVDTIGE